MPTVASLHVYPVKGCRGFSPTSWSVRTTGLAFDRAWMIVDESTGAFVSQRTIPAMARLRATISSNHSRLDIAGEDWEWSIDLHSTKPPTQPTTHPIRKTSIWGDVVMANDLGDDIAQRLRKQLGRKVRLVQFPNEHRRAVDPFWSGDDVSKTQFADFGPMLVTTMASLDDLNGRLIERGQSPVPMDRFRANIVIQDDLLAWDEDHIQSLTTDTGQSLDFIKPCARCKVVEVDQQTGVSMKDGVLDLLASFRNLTLKHGKSGLIFGTDALSRNDWPGPIEVGMRLTVGR